MALEGYKVTIFEAGPVLGGWLRVGIPEYRLPRDILEREIQHILNLGVEAKTNTVLGMDVTLQDLKKEGYKATYLAVGCQKGANLAIPGEETDGVIQGVDFLRQAALGKPIDGIKKAVVIGGGNAAVDAARAFAESWLGIPPTGKPIVMRYTDFWHIVDDPQTGERKLAENLVLIDILGVLEQAGYNIKKVLEFIGSKPPEFFEHPSEG